jgi:outer membrane protein assembly factor BamB
VGDIPHLGPTVFFGSYNGEFYALNAQTGATRWEHEDAHSDRISGSPTIVNHVVYYSDLDDNLTTGLNVLSGKPVFSFNQGAFSPVVATPGAIFLSGHYVLYKFVPSKPKTKTKKH